MLISLANFKLFEFFKREELALRFQPGARYRADKATCWEPMWERVKSQSLVAYGVRRGEEGVEPVVVKAGTAYVGDIPIDGQDRVMRDEEVGWLVTTQLFLATLRDFACRASHPLEDVVRLVKATQGRRDAWDRNLVCPFTSDQSAFDAVVTAGSPAGVRDVAASMMEAGSPPESLAMSECYLYFWGRLDGHLRRNLRLEEAEYGPHLVALFDAATRHSTVDCFDILFS